MAIRIITDSTADIRGSEVDELKLKIIPLNVNFGDDSYMDGVDISVDEFYSRLASSTDFPKTSQPAPGLFAEEFDKAKEANDDIIYIGISSGLSGTINAARMAKNIVDYNKIHIVDSLESIQGLRLMVLRACEMRDNGATALEIVNEMNYLKKNIKIVSVIDTLEYLSKGGRLGKVTAMVGNMIGLKPLIDLNPEGKIRMYGKAIGLNRAYRSLLHDIEEFPINFDYKVCFGYTSGIENLNKLIEKVLAVYSIKDYDISRVGPTIGAHIGEGGFCMIYVSTKPRN